MGILEAGFSTFALLLAIRAYEATAYGKATLAAGISIGLLLSPMILSLVRATRLPVNMICSGLMIFAGACLVGVSLTESVVPYVAGLALAQIAIAQLPSLLIQVHSSNYPEGDRGKLVSWNFIVSATAAMLVSYAFGAFLDHRWEDRSWIFTTMGFASFAGAIALGRLPSRPLPIDLAMGFRASFQLIHQDRLFAIILLGWMLLGLGWLTTLPLRIEYLGGTQGGLDFSNQEIAILIMVIPSLARIASSRFWGHLFDRLRFVTFRIALNLCLLFSVILFFNANDFYALCLASIFTGIAFGGSSIAWSLWVTRLAPAGKEAAYMSVHVALTGVRGMMAPFWGYYLFTQVGFRQTAWISAGFLVLSTVCFLMIRKHHRLNPSN